MGIYRIGLLYGSLYNKTLWFWGAGRTPPVVVIRIEAIKCYRLGRREMYLAMPFSSSLMYLYAGTASWLLSLGGRHNMYVCVEEYTALGCRVFSSSTTAVESDSTIVYQYFGIDHIVTQQVFGCEPSKCCKCYIPIHR